MTAPSKVPAEWWIKEVEGSLIVDPRIPRRGGPTDALPVGHLVSPSGRREIVYSTQGPLPGLRAGAWVRESDARILVHQPEGRESGVRPLLPEEAWRAHGGEAGPWAKCIRAGEAAHGDPSTGQRTVGSTGELQVTLALWALRTAPPNLAETLTRAALVLAQSSPPRRAGVCSLPEEDRVWARMQQWLYAWRLRPDRPSEILGRDGFLLSPPTDEEGDDVCRRLREMFPQKCDPILPSPYAHGPGALLLHALAAIGVAHMVMEAGGCCPHARAAACGGALAGCLAIWGASPAPDEEPLPDDDRHCGGGPHQRPSRDPAQLVHLTHLQGPSGARRRHGLNPRVAPLATRSALEEEKVRLILGKLADGTRKTYSLGWRWWALFCGARGVEPLRWVTEATRMGEQDRLLDFVVHLSTNGHRAPGTIKTYLSAIRARHVAAGHPDPTAGMTRLWMAMDGLKRMHGAPTRKKPVTVAMLRALRATLLPDQGGDGRMLWAAILMAFFYLLRASEYCSPSSVGLAEHRGLRGCDLTFKRAGQEVAPTASPDELIVCIRGSKTDQYNRGEHRNHFLSGDPAYCVVSAVATYARARPGRYRGAHELGAFFTNERDQPLLRGQVQEALAHAAVDAGADPKDIGTHSLRIGGASALWNTFRDTALVQRWGRWTSSAFQSYLWDARALAEGVSGRMIAADFTPT